MTLAFASLSLLASQSGKLSAWLQSWLGSPDQTWSYAHQQKDKAHNPTTGAQSASLIDIKMSKAGTMSAFRGKADIRGRAAMSAIDPKRTWQSRCALRIWDLPSPTIEHAKNDGAALDQNEALRYE
jgi:hypothetical protein